MTGARRPAPATDAWQHSAPCAAPRADADWLSGTGAKRSMAVRICRTSCTVREACLEAAMREEDGEPAARRAGVRGGLTPTERVVLQTDRAAEAVTR